MGQKQCDENAQGHEWFGRYVHSLGTYLHFHTRISCISLHVLLKEAHIHKVKAQSLPITLFFSFFFFLWNKHAVAERRKLIA